MGFVKFSLNLYTVYNALMYTLLSNCEQIVKSKFDAYINAYNPRNTPSIRDKVSANKSVFLG